MTGGWISPNVARQGLIAGISSTCHRQPITAAIPPNGSAADHCRGAVRFIKQL